MEKGLFLLILTMFFSCGSVKVNGESRFRLETIGNILKNCSKNQKVVVRAKYLGWRCPADCKNPGITRSDSCIADSTGCIYLMGRGNLDPITDRRKAYIFKGIVGKFRNVCYLKVLKADELK